MRDELDVVVRQQPLEELRGELRVGVVDLVEVVEFVRATREPAAELGTRAPQTRASADSCRRP